MFFAAIQFVVLINQALALTSTYSAWNCITNAKPCWSTEYRRGTRKPYMNASCFYSLYQYNLQRFASQTVSPIIQWLQITRLVTPFIHSQIRIVSFEIYGIWIFYTVTPLVEAHQIPKLKSFSFRLQLLSLSNALKSGVKSGMQM